jgi:hypothetical protein
MRWASWAGVILVSGVTSDVVAAETDLGPASERATADKAVSESAVSIAALAGFGFGEEFEEGGVNRYGVAYGVRGGYTLPRKPLYIGGAALRYAGGSGGVGEVDSLIVGVEFGYDVQPGPFILRPYLGVGALWGHVVQSDNEGYLLEPHVVPGFLAQYQVAFVTLGAEVRYEVAFEWTNALSVLGSVGGRI